MNLHLEKNLFEEIIDMLNNRTGVAVDILEKDYYVCLVLMEIAKNQSETGVFFKGGTAIYKILNEMNRFSEDIDLTVKVLENISNTQNIKRLKKSALGYEIQGLELLKDLTIDKKGSVTGIYKYDSVFEMPTNPLHKAGKIQVESTSFTVSEPTEKYKIAPLIYNLANDEEKNILKEKFGVCEFEIEIIKLERMFIDKLFAAEFYFLRNEYMDVAKHLYDITILYNNKKIQKLLNNREELEKLVTFKRKEESVRIGGIDYESKILDFSYLKCDFDNKLIETIKIMQNKYILNSKYKIEISQIKECCIKILQNEKLKGL